jgi:hypothetical protein
VPESSSARAFGLWDVRLQNLKKPQRLCRRCAALGHENLLEKRRIVTQHIARIYLKPNFGRIPLTPVGFSFWDEYK